jgi:uncharacterized protein (DUF427 family)
MQDSRRIELRPGQESVWDYPRPPRLERTERHIQIVFNDVTIADTRSAWRVLETSHPPVYYLPREDLKVDTLMENPRQSFCEWKGVARYLDIRVGDLAAPGSGWYYPNPTDDFRPIRDHVAFYPGVMDRCVVDGEIVRPQPGGFYGGWITSDIVGPFKGEPGTEFW